LHDYQTNKKEIIIIYMEKKIKKNYKIVKIFSKWIHFNCFNCLCMEKSQAIEIEILKEQMSTQIRKFKKNFSYFSEVCLY